MAYADLSNTSFGSTPSEGLEVVDIYKSEELESLLASGTVDETCIELLEAVYPTISSEQIINVLNDTDLNDYLDENDTDFSTEWSSIDAYVPSGLSKSSVLSAFSDAGLSFAALFKWASELSDGIDTTLFNSMSVSDYISFFTKLIFYKNKYEIDDTDNTTIKTWEAVVSADGFDDTGTTDVIKVVYKQGVAEKLLSQSSVDYIWDWLNESDDGITDSQRADMFAYLCPIAGQYMHWSLLENLIDGAGDSLTAALKAATIKAILNYYALGSDTTPDDYSKTGTALIGYLDLVDDTWDTGYRNGTDIQELDNYLYATDDALTVLTYTERCRASAVIVRDNSLSIESYSVLAEELYPILYVD